MSTYVVRLNGDYGLKYVEADDVREASKIVKREYPHHQGYTITRPGHLPRRES